MCSSCAKGSEVAVDGSGALVVVATPIGNLGDLSPRAIQELTTAGAICCEDTRRTRALLSAAGVRAGGRLRSLHRHNEVERIPEMLRLLEQGGTVAVVSDAGTPGISDPGSRLVAAAAETGHQVRTVPGPSAVLAALVVSGLATDRFAMEGFLPRRGSARRHRLDAVASDARTTIVLEAPTRLAATLADLLDACGDRRAVVARELTKMHEEVWRGTLSTLARRAAQDGVRGEVVIVVSGAPEAAAASDEELVAAVRSQLASGMGVRDAASAVAAAAGVGRRRVYQLALQVASEAP